MKPVEFHRAAENEMIKSARFYELRSQSLGEAFLDAVESTLITIQNRPALGKLEVSRTRSYKLKRFPFRVVYLEQPLRVWVVAVAHLSRKPGYWRKRLD